METLFQQQTIDLGRLSISRLSYQDPQGALRAWESLDQDGKEKLGGIYQRGFGGPPWFEVGRCQVCGSFTDSVSRCSNPACGNTDAATIGEAYPLNELIGTDLPAAFGKFTPGVLLIARGESGETLGFANGGGIPLAELVWDKYADQDPQRITDSILATVANGFGIGVDATTPVAYDNEAVVDPQFQGQKVGPALNWYRIQALQSLMPGAMICGRSVNKSWLNIKAMQFASSQFDMLRFVPAGDTYQAKGQPREFYIARKRQAPWKP